MSRGIGEGGEQPTTEGGRLDSIVDSWSLGVGLIRNVSIRVGLNLGIAAYLLGYATTYALLFIEAGGSLDDYLSPNSEFVLEPVGWVFYGAHNVRLSATNLGTSQNVNYLLNAHDALDMAIPTLVYYAVPVVVLVLAGYLAANRVDARTVTVGILAGASIVFGYLIMAYLGAYFLEVIVRRSRYVKPDIRTTILLIGLAYPIVFGAIGGAIAGARAPEPALD